MKTFYITIIFIGVAFISQAQEESEACMPPSKKVMKLITDGINAQDARTAAENFNAAIEAENNATAYYEYAMFAYESGLDQYERNPDPSQGDKSFAKAQAMFQKALDVCADFHANCSYYLGVISYTQQDVPTAIKWFKQFRAYSHTDTKRYPDDYDKKLKDVSEVLGDLEEEATVKSTKVPFEPRIVQNVSTSDNEYFPMITPDNEQMFYTRKLSKGNLGDYEKVVEEFTMSKRTDMKATFDGGNPLAPPFNISGKFDSYGAATLSVDNKEMIFCACKAIDVFEQRYMNCDLYSSTFELTGDPRQKYKWSEPVNLGTSINDKARWDGQPSLSADGNTLYYAVNGPSTRNNDIFVAERNPDGTWRDARPFDEINTDGKDKSPFLHQDSETLYFVSDVSKDRPGVGGLDIFYTRMENGAWSKPKNIGYPINTQDDELGIFVSIDGEIAYYSSHVGGKWNIYSFELYEEARPQAVAILKGELKDENGSPVENATIEVMYEGTDEVTSVKVNGDDGAYATIVRKDKPGDVMVTVKKEGNAFDSKVIAAADLKKEVSIKNNDLTVRELKVDAAYTINDILYPTAGAELNSKAKFILKGFARFLQENPTISVGIQGHTDDEGNDDLNMELSERRSQGVKSYLVSLGVSESRLSAKGYGETKPKVENNSPTNRAKNRRTDFVIQGL